MNIHYLSLEDLVIDHQTLLKIAHHFAKIEGTCLLYSGSSYSTAENSYLFLFPYEHIKIEGDLQQRYGLDGTSSFSYEKNPWNALDQLGNGIGKGEHSFPEWVGFFSYEMGAFSDQDIIIPHQKAETPEAYWQRCAITLRIEHRTGKGVVQLVDSQREFLIPANQGWYRTLSTILGWKELIQSSFLHKQPLKSTLKLIAVSDTKESYQDKIEQVKRLITSGDIYQMNLSQQWDIVGDIDAFDLFKRLAILNPAPFAAYLHTKDFSVVSSSPERFLKKQQGMIETRPIKGTAPRGKTLVEDLENKQHLLTSEKERSELMMITDLMRNDLGKISVNGSVQVPLLCGCEAYQNVFHLYSIVKSRVLNLNPFEILRACFPGGSITGCPKLRAMEVIAELERRPRGIYTGAIGYICGNGDFDFNIAIRTLVKQDQKLNVQLGGGIVIDSIPEREYEETLHKGRSIFEILAIDNSFKNNF